MAITINKDGTEKSGLVDDNVIQPFSLESSGLRGRMVRAGDVLKQIIEQHDYPLPVSYLLSEALILSLLLSSMLKYDGVFTLQIQSEGAISTIVTNVQANGHVRAYAAFDKEALEEKMNASKNVDHFSLLEKGYIAFTVDQGEHTERYQGIVGLEGDSLLDSVQHYFNQSEQIQTCIRMTIHPQDDQWRAGAVMLQTMPASSPSVSGDDIDIEHEENWRRASILLNTCSDDELLSPNLHSADVLYRLLHEEGVRIYPATSIKHVCRCSKERVEDVLKSLSKEDITDAQQEDGHINMTCEFCGKVYLFTRDNIEEIKK